MKNIAKTITAIAAILITTTGFAQNEPITATDSRSEFKFGFKAGINISNVYDEEGDDFVADNKTGFAGGMFFSIPLGQIVGFQPEFMYSQKGFEASGSNILGTYEYKRTTSYLDIPLQLQIKPTPSFTILVGPQYSYLLETKNEFNGSTSTTQEDDINSDNYKKSIFGFVVGADINIQSFVISGRAGWDISKSDSDGDTTKPRYKNQVFQLTLGYTFN
ncbi:MAG: porin family protein [Bacteroidota bacterium]